jgi:HlyD family secretion protein
MKSGGSKIAGLALAPLLAVLAAVGCSRSGGRAWQGYLEGDFVYVSSPIAGRLDKLSVSKGSRVADGAPLFELERAGEADALRQASQELQAARDQLEDLEEGVEAGGDRRARGAPWRGPRGGRAVPAGTLARQESLFKAGAISASDYDHARLTQEGNQRAVDEDSARLDAARLGAGPTPSPPRARSSARRRRRRGPCPLERGPEVPGRAPPALVYDTLYREGEFVAAGSPVVVLLPPSNIKVRFFVGEDGLRAAQGGRQGDRRHPGPARALDATVSYLSPQPEYTPPVLYNQDNRAKLVYMVEAVFAPGAGRRPAPRPARRRRAHGPK